jgi:hypothetical protein
LRRFESQLDDLTSRALAVESVRAIAFGVGIDPADGKLKYKENGGTVNALY